MIASPGKTIIERLAQYLTTNPLNGKSILAIVRLRSMAESG